MCAVMAPPRVARGKLVPAVTGPAITVPAVTRVDPVGLLGEARGETALPSCFFSHPRAAVQPFFTPRLLLLFSQGIWLGELLLVERALLTRVADFLAPLRTLRGRKTAQFVCILPPQGPLGAHLFTHLLTRVELLRLLV